MIPPINLETRLLPANEGQVPYLATLEEVHQVFVVEAPHSKRRQLIFDAFIIYSALLWDYFPSAVLWLNGGFVTYKDAPPHDLDVAFLVEQAELRRVFGNDPGALSLLTHQGVSAAQPKFENLRRLQPFGGLIDSFMVPADVEAAVGTWRDRWSMAPTPAGDGYREDLLKGYLEVRS